LFLFSSLSVLGQVDFRKHYEQENPAPSNSGIPLEERFRIHEEFIVDARQDKDTLREFLGELYVFYDNIYLNDYSTASERLLRAKTLAQASKNPGWQGWVAYRRGTLNLRLRQTDAAIAAYKNAVEKCGMAGDSLCVAENLEQISAVYALQDSFTLAREYFIRAMPMMRRHGKQVQLATAIANFGSLLNQEGKFSEAIPYLEEAMDIQQDLGNLAARARAKNNLALATLRVGKAEKALQMFKECLLNNQERGFMENALRNYAGIRESYLAMQDYRGAYDYQLSYISLRDSLIGAETKLEIAELEAKYNTAQQELELKKSQSALADSRRQSERKGMILLVILLLGLLAAWLWRRQIQGARARTAENKKNLQTVTSLLARKNEVLMKLQEEVKATAKTNVKLDEDPLVNLFDQSILTITDWTDFKVYFENTFPGYVLRLRGAFSDITEAEERLFLLLKLNLTSKEISNILGISTSSVKKTRNRLRKRLGLEPNDNLEVFIRKF
jgi:tetratricopeptide (TPR) repeat protein